MFRRFIETIDAPLTSSSTTNSAYCGSVADGRLDGLYPRQSVSARCSAYFRPKAGTMGVTKSPIASQRKRSYRAGGDVKLTVMAPVSLKLSW